MTLDEIDLFCQQLPGCEVRYPFTSNPDIRTWSVNKKMFAWTNVTSRPLIVQIKADPDAVPDLVASYTAIQPGYHMNKRHWISVQAAVCDETMLQHLLEDGHALIVAKLPKREQLRLLSD